MGLVNQNSHAKLQPHDPALHGPLFDGPVDDIEQSFCGHVCCRCGGDLLLTLKQDGRCHSGRFATAVLRDHLWCESCEDIYVFADEYQRKPYPT